MPDLETVGTWQGRTMPDRDSGRIGTIDATYTTDHSVAAGEERIDVHVVSPRHRPEVEAGRFVG
jgi:hypothetical protein